MTNWGTKKRSIDDNINKVAAVDSPLLLTQFSFEASQLIKSFTKYMPFVVIILILITSITTIDLVVRPSGFFTNVLADKTIDTMTIAVSILLIIFLICTVRPVLRSQKILDKWSNLFENNSIRTGILLSINNKSKEEILKALSKNLRRLHLHYKIIFQNLQMVQNFMILMLVMSSLIFLLINQQLKQI